MSNRLHRLDDGSTASDSLDLSVALSQLNKLNAKLERMYAKIGTSADNSQFRDLIAAERKDATKLTRQIVEHIKFNRIRGPTITQAEVEYKRLTAIVEQIDTKQKQQLVSIAHQKHDPLADEILREEAAAGRSNSLASVQLADANIQFLEYNLDEIAERHQQIRHIETDINEMVDMWKDLQTLVDEQQVHIDVIEQNIVETKDKVEKGHLELEQAENYQTKARKKACCSALIIVIILAIVVVVVLVLKKQF